MAFRNERTHQLHSFGLQEPFVMNLPLLLLVPVIVFVVVATLSFVTSRLLDADRWWSFPAYMAICLPSGFAAVALIIYVVGLAFGVVPQ